MEPEASDTLILYREDYRREAVALANHFRKSGMNIILQKTNDGFIIEDYLAYAKRMNAGGILLFEKDDEIKVIDIATGGIQIAPPLSELMQ
jgi:ATP phosphoribosyltransferase regulatory subunit